MKKTFIAFFIALLFSLTGYAREVSEQYAREYVVDYISLHTTDNYTVKSIVKVNACYYLINLAPQGRVILSADDVATPVLGYSLSGSLEEEKMPANMRYVMSEFEEKIQEVILTEKTQHPYWMHPSTSVTRAGDNKIEPLIQVNWNQGAPFNAYCPRQKAVVGCVAVAMAQAMSVQRYPSRPQGQVSYAHALYGALNINFDNERAYNWDNIMNPQYDSYDEVARLLYHAGMSVRMDYGEDGSGIPSNEVSRISQALMNHFSYPEGISYHWLDRYDGDWKQLILNELQAGRAVVYNAIDSKARAGHSFNIDGYDGSSLFHVNWGWGGYGNGDFSLSYLRDASMNMNYDEGHVMVIGIGSPDQMFRSISLSSNRIEEGLTAGAVVGSLAVNGEEPSPNCEFSVHGVYNSAAQSYTSVPFTVEEGLLKTTECLTQRKEPWNIEITVSDPESGESLTQGFRVFVDPWQSLEATTSLEYDRAKETFILKTKHNVKYSLTNEAGTEVENGNLEPVPELVIDMKELPKGKYLLRLQCEEEVKDIKIINNK